MSTLFAQLGAKVKTQLDTKLSTSGGTVTGNLVLGGTLQVASYSSSNLPSAGTSGTVIFVSDGDGGSPCLAIDNGSSWLISSLGSAIPQAIHITDELGNSLLTEAGDILITDA
jgi:hypothetical protein